MKGKQITKVVLKISSLVLPMVLAYINHLQMKDEVAELVDEALTSKKEAGES